MLWFFYSILAGLGKAFTDLISKKLLKKSNETTVIWGKLPFLVFFFFILVITSEIPQTNWKFWGLIMLIVPIDIIALFAYLKAIKKSELSIVAPILGFVPIFILFTEFIISGVLPTLKGLIGILIIFFGVYILGVSKNSNGIFKPILAIYSNKGARFAFITALLYSIEPIFINNAAKITNVSFTILITVLGNLIFFTIYGLYKKKINFEFCRNKLPSFFILGSVTAVDAFFTFFAMQTPGVLVNYSIAIKRISIIISVIFGYLFFKEKRIKKRIFASIIIFIGVILIASS